MLFFQKRSGVQYTSRVIAMYANNDISWVPQHDDHMKVPIDDQARPNNIYVRLLGKINSYIAFVLPNGGFMFFKCINFKT